MSAAEITRPEINALVVGVTPTQLEQPTAAQALLGRALCQVGGHIPNRDRSLPGACPFHAKQAIAFLELLERVSVEAWRETQRLPRVQLVRPPGREPFARVVAGNGEEVWRTSETYADPRAAFRAVEILAELTAGTVPVIDEASE